VVFAVAVVEHPEAERSAQPLGPQGGMIAVVSGPIQQDSHAGDRLTLRPAEPPVGVVAGIVDEDSHAGQARALTHVLGLVDVVAFGVQQHRNAQHGRALHARLRATVGIVSRKVDHDQHGSGERNRTFVINVVATQINNRAHLGHLLQLIGILARAAHHDVARRGHQMSHDRPANAGDGSVVLPFKRPELLEQLGVDKRYEGLGGRV